MELDEDNPLPRLLLEMPEDGEERLSAQVEWAVRQLIRFPETLAQEGISVRVINIHTIKPLDKEIVIKAAKETGTIVTAEEHSIIGGLGSAVAEAVAEAYPVPVRRVGVNDIFGHSGPAVELLKQFGLSAEHIAEVVREAVKAK